MNGQLQEDGELADHLSNLFSAVYDIDGWEALCSRQGTSRGRSRKRIRQDVDEFLSAALDDLFGSDLAADPPRFLLGRLH